MKMMLIHCRFFADFAAVYSHYLSMMIYYETKACVCIPRKMVVIEQLRDMKRWKKKHEYGMRWIAESAFSSIKRTFGEYVSSIKWNNIVNELLLKASIYNMFVDKMAAA